MNEQIKTLQDEGYQVRVHHGRLTEDEAQVLAVLRLNGTVAEPDQTYTAYELRSTGKRPSPTGGMTIVEITRDDDLVAQGIALCSPFDNYDRKIGRTIALGRALKHMRKEVSA